jgi:hypothetical protein
MGEVKNAYKLSVGKPDGKKPLCDMSLDERIRLKRSYEKN